MGRAARQGLVEVLLALAVLGLGLAGTAALWGGELRALTGPGSGASPQAGAREASR
jgi:hypothetical protein